MTKDNNPVVTIELDRIRELRFGHKAMKRWAAYTGKSIGDVEAAVLHPEEIEPLLFFMLEQDAAAHGETLRMEQMEDLLDLVPPGVVYEKLSEAMSAAFPSPADDGEPQSAKNAKRAAAGTGKKA